MSPESILTDRLVNARKLQSYCILGMSRWEPALEVGEMMSRQSIDYEHMWRNDMARQFLTSREDTSATL